MPHSPHRQTFAALLVAVALAPGCTGNLPASAVRDDTNTPANGGNGSIDPNSIAVVGGTTVSLGACQSEMNTFAAKVWLPAVGVDCLACHVKHGMAPQAGAKFILTHPSESNYMTANLAAVRAMNVADANGMSHILAKATNTVPHGGGARFAVGSGPYNALQAFLTTPSFATGCDQAVTQAKLQNVIQLSNQSLVRKAALQVAGRLPTSTELTLADSNLDAALQSVINSPSFGDYVMRVFDDTYLTVGANVNNVGIDKYSYDDNIAPDYCASTPLGGVVYRGCQLYWYGDAGPSNVPNVDDHDTVQRALTSTGLRLVRYLATTGHDYRDILNADYMMLNPWSARSLSNDFSYNLLTETHWQDPNDPSDFEPVKPNKPKWPTVGLLTDAGFMDTYSTTATNRNRKRAKFIYQYFLGMDILSLSQRPANLNALLEQSAKDPNALPPFMNNGACTDCHALIDPLAGNFAAYNDNINFTSPADNADGPYGPYKMFAAGFEGTPEPNDQKEFGPRWLAQQITADPRFARAMVTWWYTILTSQSPLHDAPAATQDINAYLAAQRYQDGVFTQITADFVASGYNIQVAIKELMQSPYYRSKDIAAALPASDAAMLETLVPYRWTGPDVLNTKLLATTGMTLYSSGGQFNGWGWLNQPLVREYEGLLGGVDAMAGVTLPNYSATGLMVRISTTTASQVACQLVASEFDAAPAARHLLAGVDPNVLPDNAAHVAQIKSSIAAVYQWVTGATAAEVQANLNDAYDIFTSSIAADAGANDSSLPSACQHGSITQDPTHTVRAWIAVMAYILSDPRLVQE